MEKETIKVYHGTYLEIQNPDLFHTNADVDFGPGFYLTEDINMASIWASHKNPSIINHYELNFSGLRICHLKLDEAWLNYIAKNRGYLKTTFNDDKYDIIIGPTADNGVHIALSNYVSGKCTVEEALFYIDNRHLHEQILLKSNKALSQLTYVDYTTLSKNEIALFLQKENESMKMAAKFVVNCKKDIQKKIVPLCIDLSNYEER